MQSRQQQNDDDDKLFCDAEIQLELSAADQFTARYNRKRQNWSLDRASLIFHSHTDQPIGRYQTLHLVTLFRSENKPNSMCDGEVIARFSRKIRARTADWIYLPLPFVLAYVIEF